MAGPQLDLGTLLAHVSLEYSTFQSSLKAVENQLNKAAVKFTILGAAMSAAVTYPLKKMATSFTREFADFDDQITKNMAILGEATDEVRKQYEELSLDISKTMPIAATKVAEGLFHLGQAGLDAAQSLKAMPEVTKFAVAGMMNLDLATEVLIQSQNALGLASKDPEKNLQGLVRVSDNLTEASIKTTASIFDFASAVSNYAGQAARLVGKDIEEVTAVLMAFAQQGIKGEEAGYRVSMMLRDLQKASLNNRDAWKKMGVEVYDSEGQMRNLGDIIMDLEHATAGWSDEAKRVGFTMMGFMDRSLMATMALMGFGKYIKETEKSLIGIHGTTDKVANKMADSWVNSMRKMWNAMAPLRIGIGKVLAEQLSNLRYIVDALMNVWNKLSEPARKAVVRFLELAAAIGPASLLLGGFAKILSVVVGIAGVVLSPLGLIASAIVYIGLSSKTAASVFGKSFDSIGEAISGLIDKIKNWTEADTMGLIAWAKSLWLELGALKDKFWAFAEWLRNDFASATKTAFNTFTAVITESLKGLGVLAISYGIRIGESIVRGIYKGLWGDSGIQAKAREMYEEWYAATQAPSQQTWEAIGGHGKAQDYYKQHAGELVYQKVDTGDFRSKLGLSMGSYEWKPKMPEEYKRFLAEATQAAQQEVYESIFGSNEGYVAAVVQQIKDAVSKETAKIEMFPGGDHLKEDIQLIEDELQLEKEILALEKEISDVAVNTPLKLAPEMAQYDAQLTYLRAEQESMDEQSSRLFDAMQQAKTQAEYDRAVSELRAEQLLAGGKESTIKNAVDPWAGLELKQIEEFKGKAEEILRSLYAGVDERSDASFNNLSERLNKNYEEWSKYAEGIASELRIPEERFKELLGEYKKNQEYLKDQKIFHLMDSLYDGLDERSSLYFEHQKALLDNNFGEWEFYADKIAKTMAIANVNKKLGPALLMGGGMGGYMAMVAEEMKNTRAQVNAVLGEAKDKANYDLMQKQLHAFDALYDGMDQRSTAYWDHQRKLMETDISYWEGRAAEIAKINNISLEQAQALIAAYAKERRLLQEINEAKAGDSFIAGWNAQFKEMEHELPKLGEVGAEAAKTFRDSMVDATTDALMGVTTLKAAIQAVAADMARMAIRNASNQLYTTLFSNIASAFAGNMAGKALPSTAGGGAPITPNTGTPGTMYAAKGNVFWQGHVVPFKYGDIVNSPTFFPMAKGDVGLMGEAGTEAVMPLRRDSAGRLGVTAEVNLPQGREDSNKRIEDLLRQIAAKDVSPQVFMVNSEEEVLRILASRRGREQTLNTVNKYGK